MLLALTAVLAAACGGNGGEAGDGDGGATDGGAQAEDLGLIEDGTLIVGSDIAFKPMEYVEDGENKGFDIDLVNEIGDRLGLEVEFINTGFDGLLSQVAANQYDLAASSITITEERRQTVAFSKPYFEAGQAIVAPADSAVSGEGDLTGGVRLGVQAATTGFQYATQNLSEAATVEFPTSEAAFTALEAGQLDAVFIDQPVAAANTEDSDLEVKEVVDTGEEYGMAINQDNTALLEAVNEQLDAIIADGTYEEIYNSYFDTEVPEAFRPGG